MKTRRCLFTLLALAVAAPPARALVPGGGPAKSDCYAEWQVTTLEVTANKGKTGVDCEDGDARCDLDGEANGSCTLGISVCVFQADVPGCTPQPVSAMKLMPPAKVQAIGLQLPTLPATQAACGQAALTTLALKTGRKGQKPSKPLTLKLLATASGTPPKDRDKVTLRCVPNKGAGQCPANASGGPSGLTMRVGTSGTDLDNGWTGLSQNFPVVAGATLRACLRDCDGVSDPACAGDEAATDQANGATFGPPLPLFSANVPVCVVNRFGSPKLTDLVADVTTGVITALLHLESGVYLTTATGLCPRCSGSDIGKAGICDSGPRQGQACKTEGLLTVTLGPEGTKNYRLSSDCPPSPLGLQGTLTLTLPLTTSSSQLAGPKPCQGQADDNDCRGGTCDATCTGIACETTVNGQCVDTKGGVSQVCCSTDTTRPCFPTAGGGQIVRTGMAAAPMPAGDTYPKTADGVLAATFCEPATASALINGVTGLPGPGALILPVAEEWAK